MSTALLKDYSLLKRGIWAYFLLLIFEGALRKWFLPSLAAPLLIIRDPVALWIILLANKKNLFPKSAFVVWMLFVGIVSIFMALFFGHGNLQVALYGARPLMIHFPLIFAIGKIFDQSDVIQMGKVAVVLTIPMTILIGLQFSSPQTAWVNIAVGGVIEEQGFQGALGHFRPSATFSFITGTYLFYGFAASFIFYFWLNSYLINRLALIIATVCLLAAIPLSISRTLFFEVSLVIAFFFVVSFINKQYFNKMLLTVLAGLGVLLILSKTSFFQHATDTFFARFTDANGAEGGIKGTLGDRFLGGLISAISTSGRLPFFGYGIGMGTNVGSQLLVGGRLFLLHEEEWGRNIDELGPLLGEAVILIRLLLSIKLALVSFKKMAKGNILPWMLVSFGFLAIAQGNWSQPTSLGFCVLTAGLIIGAFQDRTSKMIANTAAALTQPLLPDLQKMHF